jgi:hypothetical protein
MSAILLSLAKEILQNSPEGISKVKFAKTIYFIFKGLVQEKLFSVEDLSFIRMPLGPVPNGFMALKNDSGLKVMEKNNGSLAYNSQVYFVSDKVNKSKLDDNQKDKIKQLTSQIEEFKTYELVGFSHQEPSWVEFPNGTTYFLSKSDLEIKVPKKSLITKLFKKEENVNENGRLQEQLVEGMLSDIVEESTTLEYPE